jgi:hypothetical protein
MIRSSRVLFHPASQVLLRARTLRLRHSTQTLKMNLFRIVSSNLERPTPTFECGTGSLSTVVVVCLNVKVDLKRKRKVHSKCMKIPRYGGSYRENMGPMYYQKVTGDQYNEIVF